MQPWTVRDVMTNEVLAVDYETPPAEVVKTMTTFDVSAVAVVGEYDNVLGVVTRTDVLNGIDMRPAGRPSRLPWRRPVVTPAWIARSAGEMMSAPAITVEPDATLAEAGRRMRRSSVNRLLVAGPDQRLLGIVTAADLLKPHDRPDEEIRADVRQALAPLSTSDVAFDVHDGVATIAGTVADARIAELLEPVVRAVPGVTTIRNEVIISAPPTLPTAPAVRQPHRRHHDWWPTRRPQHESRPTAALAALY
jgi:CBS domain-containing protein